MNKYVNSEVSQHVMKLLQIGASVQVVRGKMIYVKYNVSPDFEVAYVYHVNKKNKYFLERIKPYPVPIKEFDTANDVINIIKIDIEQYTKAIQSKRITDFIEINNGLHQAIKSFEDLFLYYNVDNDCIENIKADVKDIQDRVKIASCKCERLFFEKDPENL